MTGKMYNLIRDVKLLEDVGKVKIVNLCIEDYKLTMTIKINDDVAINVLMKILQLVRDNKLDVIRINFNNLIVKQLEMSVYDPND